MDLQLGRTLVLVDQNSHCSADSPEQVQIPAGIRRRRLRKREEFGACSDHQYGEQRGITSPTKPADEARGTRHPERKVQSQEVTRIQTRRASLILTPRLGCNQACPAQGFVVMVTGRKFFCVILMTRVILGWFTFSLDARVSCNHYFH